MGKDKEKDKEQDPEKIIRKIDRLNVLYVISTLKNYSSESHPLSISDITRHVNRKFYRALTNQDASINNSTVTRILNALYSDSNLAFQSGPMDYFDDNANLGFNVYCVMKDKNNTWVTYDAPAGEKGPTKYYYYESVFSDKELITLIDAVETYNYFSTDDIAGLVAKLLALRPQSEVLDKYHEPDAHRLKDEDSLVLFNIDEFSRIIKNQEFAKIEYCNYDHNFDLVPREGYPRIIRPLSMMWSNGYYYLVALLNPGYTPANLRMDRITDIEAITPTAQMLKQFQVDMNLDVSTYRMNHPVMHGGKVRHISLLYLDSPYNGMTNAIVDTFGRTTTITPASKEEIETHLPASVLFEPFDGVWMQADFYATTAGTELFATQYCRYCKVISPSSLAEDIAANLKAGLKLYP